MKDVKIIKRKNPLCVICKTPNENGWHDIQTNSAWSTNPYGDEYAEVLDELVEGAMETYGYLIPTFNEERTKLVDYKPTEIPVFPEPEHEPTAEEITLDLLADHEYRLCMMELGMV